MWVRILLQHQSVTSFHHFFASTPYNTPVSLVEFFGFLALQRKRFTRFKVWTMLQLAPPGRLQPWSPLLCTFPLPPTMLRSLAPFSLLLLLLLSNSVALVHAYKSINPPA